ncbi:MAG: DUF5711 family protein [Oscillospiraceae bacterium]|jgi:hypothetical protein|nr:DUF5711 family protein [Oscillospiraceae bacterium]
MAGKKKTEKRPRRQRRIRNDKISAKQVSFSVLKRKAQVKRIGSYIRKIVIRLILCLLAFLIILFIYQNRYDLSYNGMVQWVHDSIAKTGNGDGYPLAVSGSRTLQFEEFNGTVLTLSNTSLIAYNPSGKRAAERLHGFNAPVVSTGDKRLLIYDMGGKAYKIESISETIYKGSAENRIIVADMGENGAYAIAAKEEQSFASVTLYQSDNTQVLKWASTEYQVVDVAVSPNGKSVAVAGIKAKNGDICSVVKVFKQDKKTAVASYEIEGCMYMALEYLSADNLAVVGDTGVTVMKVGDNTASNYSYGGRHLACYDISYNDGAALALSKYSDRRNCTLFIIGKNGLKISEKDANIDALDVKFRGKYIYVTTDGKLYSYKTNGTLFNSYDAGAGSKRVAVNGHYAYISGLSSIRRIEL